MPTPHRPELNALFNLPPTDAINYLKDKGYKIGWDWHETLDDAHSRAFTVAKIARIDVLQDIKKSLITALENGQSFEKWKADITPILQEKGWWGRKTVINPEGLEQEVQLGSPRRLRTIFETNMQSAFSAGRYKAMLAGAETRPYWEWRHVTINNPRKQHVALDGRIFGYDDDFWSVAFPPSEWGCKCRVIARSAREVAGKEILSSDGYKTEIYENIGVDRGTGHAVQAKRTQFNIPTKDGSILSFAPAAGFNGSPATSYLIDNVLVKRAADLLGDTQGLKKSQELLNNKYMAKTHANFINNALKRIEPKNEVNYLGTLQNSEVNFLVKKKQNIEGKILLINDEIIVNKKYSDVSISELVALPNLLTQVELKLWDETNNTLYFLIPNDLVVEFIIQSGYLQVSRIFKHMPTNNFEVIK